MAPESLRPHTRAEREAIARRLIPLWRRKFGDGLLAVATTGSLARGDDRAFSDLELVVFLRTMPGPNDDPYLQRIVRASSRDAEHKPTLCVWELVPVQHEQRAWTHFLRSSRDEAAVRTWIEDLGCGMSVQAPEHRPCHPDPCGQRRSSRSFYDRLSFEHRHHMFTCAVQPVRIPWEANFALSVDVVQVSSLPHHPDQCEVNHANGSHSGHSLGPAHPKRRGTAFRNRRAQGNNVIA